VVTIQGVRRVLPLLLLVLACAACSGGSDGPDNRSPIAHLTVDPPLARVGEVVTLDASDSVDPDGVVVSYRFVFSDGTPDIVVSSPVFEHQFPRGGRYQIALVVTDDGGATGRLETTLTIVEDPPDHGCLSDDACRDGERCDSGLCIPTVECSASLPCPAPLQCIDDFCRCPGDTALCGIFCVALATDPANCGTCGDVCAAPATCTGGDCIPPVDCGDLTLCDDRCVDILTDVDHCGGCDRPCPDDATCSGGSCTGLCGDGLTSCGTECVDLRTDPNHCGDCGIGCPTGFCSASTCQIGPPGTLITIFMPAYDGRAVGLTYIDGQFWAMINGRRLQHFDPFTGDLLETFFIDNSDARRAMGLAQCSLPGVAVTGAYDQGNPFMTPDLEAYDLGSAVLTTAIDELGGGAAYDADANLIYVFQNPTQELVTLDGTTFAELGRVPVSGLSFFDSFTDLALDGSGGGLWAVRPRLGMVADPLFVHIDLDTATAAYFMPFDSDWVGGIVLVDGTLWGAGQFAVYQIVP
jgi:hypothetical protein